MKRNCFKGGFCAKTGFTLIELLVVVLIIGILAAVAVPQYQKVVLKTKLSDVYSQISTWQKIVEMYILANGIPLETDPTVRFDGSKNSDIDFICDSVGYGRCINKYGAWSVGCKGVCWIDLYTEYDAEWASTNEWLSKGHIAIGYGYEGSNEWKMYGVPEEINARRLVCQWWINNYGTDRFYSGSYGDPAALCAEVGVQ